MIKWTFLIVLGVGLMLLSACGGGNNDDTPCALVTPIPLHESIPRFYGLEVRAGGHEIELANVPVNIRRGWINPPIPDRYIRDSAVAMFDMADNATVEVRVRRPEGVTDVTVRPARAGITPIIEGDEVIFTLRTWGQYTVEFNGDPLTDALHVFANPPFEPSPTARLITDRIDGALNIASGETVALMPGAVVHGGVVMGSNTRLEGRGIIWGHGPTNFVQDGRVLSLNANAIRVWGQQNVEIDGIACFNQSRWVVEFRNSEHVYVNNIKIISAGNNGDGITVQSSRHVHVSNSFVRAWDDALVIKNYSPIDSAHQTFRNIVLWVDLAQAMEIGYETNAGNESWFGGQFNRDAQIYDILFEDIDVLHALHQSVISIHNDNRALVRDVTYRNIIVENAYMITPFRYLIDFRNGGMPHTFQGYRVCDGEHWAIDNITVDGVWVLGGDRNRAGWVFNDHNGVRPITNVHISNVFWVPDQEPMWPDMDGTLAGITYIASPFVPLPMR